MNNQQEILERISNSRKPQELEAEQATVDDDSTPDAASLEHQEAETEEVIEEASDNPIEPSDADSIEVDADEELYLDFNGREISFSQIDEWEKGSMMRADYTRKTQDVAEQRKAIEQQETDFKAKSQSLDDRLAELDAVFAESQTAIDWDELREYDPSEYLKQRELQEARESALTKAKTERDGLYQERNQGQMQAELQRLASLNPHWIDNGKETKAYQEDMGMVRDYLNDLGLNETQQAGILLTGHGQAYVDAAKFHKGQKKNVAAVKQVKKAPVVTKPGGARISPKVTAIEKAEKAHAKHGTIDTAIALRKARRNAA